MTARCLRCGADVAPDDRVNLGRHFVAPVREFHNEICVGPVVEGDEANDCGERDGEHAGSGIVSPARNAGVNPRSPLNDQGNPRCWSAFEVSASLVRTPVTGFESRPQSTQIEAAGTPARPASEGLGVVNENTPPSALSDAEAGLTPPSHLGKSGLHTFDYRTQATDGFWERCAAARDAKLAAAPPARKPGRARCEPCGLLLQGTERCGAHPAADVIPWTRGMQYAMHYVEAAARREPDLDAWVRTVDAEDGTQAAYHSSTAELTLALSLARRWRRDTFCELPLPEPAGMTLFGARRS